MKYKRWYLIGYLPDGREVYLHVDGDFAVEYDYEYLEDATLEQLETVVVERPRERGDHRGFI